MSKNGKYEIYKTKDYQNIREVLENAFDNYPDNVAFKLKVKAEKNKTEYNRNDYFVSGGLIQPAPVRSDRGQGLRGHSRV